MSVNDFNEQVVEETRCRREPEQIAKTLFIVSCSAGKSEKHEDDTRWIDVMHQEKYSEFQEFAFLREELSKFYSNIESDAVAKDLYHGFRCQSPLRWRRAWNVNRNMPSSGVSRAVYRYQGQLYKALGQGVRRGLADGTLNNILIISALNGPTLPSDYLPYYDLTMGDLWNDKVKLKHKWVYWMRKYAGDALRSFLKDFEEVNVMVGDEYRPAAMAIKELMPNVRKYREAQSFGIQSSNVWGRELNEYLSILMKSKGKHDQPR